MLSSAKPSGQSGNKVVGTVVLVAVAVIDVAVSETEVAVAVVLVSVTVLGVRHALLLTRRTQKSELRDLTLRESEVENSLHCFAFLGCPFSVHCF